MQNWNAVLHYVKANLGLKGSNLEFTDSELIDYFKTQTLSEFSNHCPRRTWMLVNPPSPLLNTSQFYTNWVYELDNKNQETILDIASIYRDNYNHIFTSGIYLNNPVDTVMANTLSTMIEHLQPINTFEFIQPNIIKFEFDPNTGGSYPLIAEIYVEHRTLEEIPRDMFQKLFKLMALADTFTLIINTRNKFSNVSTPFGQIDLNIDYIQQRLDTIKQKIDDIVLYKPHRDYLVFL